MKKHLISLSTLLIILVVGFTGCAKEEAEPEDPNTTTTGGTTGPSPIFTYTVNGSTIKADSAVYYPQFTTIYSYKGGIQNTIEINLSDLIVGTYSISSVTGNQLTYVSSGKTYNASGGTVKITSASSNRLSGDFSCSLSSGTLTAISGQFTEIGAR